MSEKIEKKEILFYGIGDFACNGFFTIVSSFLMYFYTDIAAIDLAAVGWIILFSRIMDAVSCLAMGSLIDRTRTRWGQARPYLVGTVFPLCLSLILLYFVPEFSMKGKILYGLITASLFSVLYSGLSVSYSTMMTCMTQNSRARLGFNLSKNVCANLGAFFVTSVTLLLVKQFGNGDVKKGFVLVMFVYSILYIAIMLMCFGNTRERIQIRGEKMSFGKSVRIAVKNRHWIVLCVIEFLMLTGMTMRNQGTMYYAKYCLNQEEMGSVLLSISTFLAIPMVFVVTVLAGKIGKKKSMCLGDMLLCAGVLGMRAAGTHVEMLLLFHVIASIGSGIASGMIFVMIAEVVDYSEYQTGKRPQGFLTSVVSLMMKLGVAAAGFLSAKVLEYGSYQAGAVQSLKTLQAIRINYIWIPALVAAVSVIVIRFYTLDEEYEHVLEVLKLRKQEKKTEA